MVNVETLRDNIRSLLNDPDIDEYTDLEIENAIYLAEHAHQQQMPNCTETYSVFTCVAGSRQSLSSLSTPAAAQLISVDRNGNAGSVGDSIIRVPKEDLDRFNPAWQQATAVASAREFTYSEIEPLTFFLNPPVVVDTEVMLTFSAIPEAYGTVDSNTVTTVKQKYRASLQEYALYVLFSKDAEGSVNVQRAQQHLSLASTLSGINFQQSLDQSPKNPQPKR